jgi:hypothetical protein
MSELADREGSHSLETLVYVASLSVVAVAVFSALGLW